MTQRILAVSAALSLVFSSIALGATSKLPPPKLVLVLVIDQFRADTLAKFESRFLPAKKASGWGGFNTLTSQGAYYPLAEYDILQCMTGPGHATILSGSRPYLNGLPQNNWWNTKTQKSVYLVEDENSKVIGDDQPKPHSGTSPANMTGSTIGDELKNSGYPSRVFTVALKDRAAILLGGHRADLALWHDSKVMRWVSSTKYLPEGHLPPWVEALNAKLAADKGKNLKWVTTDKNAFTSAQNQLNPKFLHGMKASFPHETTADSAQALSAPYGVEITADAAIEILNTQKLGSGKATDLLGVSFSSHDYVAHAFGPNSREAEEISIAEDHAIARIFNALEKKVPGGLKNVDVIITGDHGGTQVPENLQAGGAPAGRIDQAALQKKANELITEELGNAPAGELWVPYANDFSFFLNRPALDKKSKDAYGIAEGHLKKVLSAAQGVQTVFTLSDWKERKIPPGELGKKIMNTYFPGRSGDAVIIPQPNWIHDDDSTTHMTGWAYDRYVPLILMGPHFRGGRYAESAKIIDIAPTLAFILRVTPPSLSEGRVLNESLR